MRCNYAAYARALDDGFSTWHPAYLPLGPTLSSTGACVASLGCEEEGCGSRRPYADNRTASRAEAESGSRSRRVPPDSKCSMNTWPSAKLTVAPSVPRISLLATEPGPMATTDK